MPTNEHVCFARYILANHAEIAAEKRLWLDRMPEEMKRVRYEEAERDIAADMILFSIADLRSTIGRARKLIRAKELGIAREAWNWFARRETGWGGYGWALQVTSINPNEVRKIIGKLSPDEIIAQKGIRIVNAQTFIDSPSPGMGESEGTSAPWVAGSGVHRCDGYSMGVDRLDGKKAGDPGPFTKYVGGKH